MKFFSVIGMVVLTLATVIAAPSYAQFGGGRRAAGGPGGAPQERGDSLQNALAQDFQTRLDRLEDALKLAPEQEAAWQAYEDKVRALMTDLNTRPAAPPENQTALQKIDQQVNTARDRLTAMEDIADAARALYATLSSDQKAVADQRLAGTLPQLYSAEAGGAPSKGGTRGGFRQRPTSPQTQ